MKQFNTMIVAVAFGAVQVTALILGVILIGQTLSGCITTPGWIGGPSAIQKPTEVDLNYSETYREGSDKPDIEYSLKGKLAAGIDLHRALSFERVHETDGSGSVSISGSGSLNTEDQAKAGVALGKLQTELYAEIIPVTVGAAVDVAMKYLSMGGSIPGGTQVSSPPGDSVRTMLDQWLRDQGISDEDVTRIFGVIEQVTGALSVVE